MHGGLAGINLSEASEAVAEFLGDELALHQDMAQEIAARTEGMWHDYATRTRGSWGRMLGRLRESGVDAPETLIVMALVAALGAGVAGAMAARRRGRCPASRDLAR